MRIFLTICILLLLVSSSVTAWALYNRFEETNQRRAANALVWRAVLCDLERSSLHDKRLKPADKVRVVAFYDRLLTHDVLTNGCGLVLPRS